MHCLVTGASGFLGTHLCGALEARGHTVTQLSSKICDLTQSGSLEPWSTQVYDEIYHLATWTQAGDFCLRHPGEQWVINQLINANVLAWWQARQPQAKLVCMGASCAYAPELEMVEENYLTDQPIDSLFSYAYTKRMLYVGLLGLQRQFGLRYLCLVPATLYGPGYHTDGRQMHFIFDLIRKIVRGKLFGEPVVLWGDGYQKRELLFVQDLVRVLPQLMSACDNELINVGQGQEATIRHFATLICEMVGYDFGLIQFDTARYVGATSKCLKPDKFRRLVPNPEFTPIEHGLRQTIDWYMGVALAPAGQPESQ
jgi:GDP-L-fucose synthase